MLLGTPTSLQNYARFAHPYDFHRLRYVIAGAERLDEQVRVAWFEVVERIAALTSPGAQHAASVKTDARRGELIVLFSTDADLSRERLQEGARELGHPEIAIPRQIVHIAALPLLGSGKLDHVALRRIAEEGAK